MRVLHSCLSCFYIDNYSYQENLLPKFHKLAGHNVEIVASTETFIGGEKGYCEPGEYTNENGIPVVRLPFISLPLALISRVKAYKGFLRVIESFSPDVIFFHGPCSHELLTAAKYVKSHPRVRLIVDGHEDFSNSARTFISKNFLHMGYYRSVIKRADPYVSWYWGTLPARCDFLHDVYGIDKNKIGLLVMGADDAEVNRASDSETIKRNRAKLGFKDSDFVVVTGGKIDEAKRQVLALMDAVVEMNKNVKLLVFGPVVLSLKEEFDERLSCNRIVYIPWADTSASYDYFAVADLVAFPGRHSVYWEQAAAMGKPLLIKRWEGTTHVDCRGNVAYTTGDDADSIKSDLVSCAEPNANARMKEAALSATSKFLYSDIARKSIACGKEGFC